MSVDAGEYKNQTHLLRLYMYQNKITYQKQNTKLDYKLYTWKVIPNIIRIAVSFYLGLKF